MIYHIYSVQKKHNEKEAFFQWFDNYLNQLLGFHYTGGQILTFTSTEGVRGGEGGTGTEMGRKDKHAFLNVFSIYPFCANIVKGIIFSCPLIYSQRGGCILNASHSYAFP